MEGIIGRCLRPRGNPHGRNHPQGAGVEFIIGRRLLLPSPPPSSLGLLLLEIHARRARECCSCLSASCSKLSCEHEEWVQELSSVILMSVELCDGFASNSKLSLVQ